MIVLPKCSMNKSLLPSVFCLLGSLSPLSSQDIQFEHITLEHGLSQSAVQSILQDSKGFMWFGTFSGGLNKYDGYSFTVYQHNPDDPYSISSNKISLISEDQTGILWIGTENAGFNKFDRKTKQFIRYRYDPNGTNCLSNDNVFFVFEDHSGILWIGTLYGGLNKFNPISGQFTHYKHDPEKPNSISKGGITSICEDQFGMLWLTSSDGLNKFDPQTEQFAHFRHDPNNQNSLSDNDIWLIYEDHTGILWLGTNGGGLNKFNPETGEFIRYKHDPDLANSLSHNKVWAILEDKSGELWLGTSDGVDKFDPQTEQFTHFKHNPVDPTSVSDDEVISLYEDRSGILWLGTWVGGLNKFNRQKEQFKQYKHNPQNLNGLNRHTVKSIYKDSSGILWIGSVGNGLVKLDRTSKRLTNHKHALQNPQSIGHENVYSIYEDHSGLFWIGTKNGLNRFNHKTGQFTRYQHDPLNPNSIYKDLVFSIIEDRSGVLWIGTYSGLSKFDRRTELFEQYEHNPLNPHSLCNNTVQAIYEDRLGVLWIGTFAGLDKFDPETEQFTHYKHDPENPNSLSYDEINTICEDRSGVVWIGTAIGLNKYDRQKEQFTRYTEKDGLLNNSIQKILCDNQGNLWISTNKGLSRFNPETNKFKNYDVRDGIQIIEFSPAGYYRDGEMLFGGIDGFISFYPELIEDNPHKPPVVITDFQLLSRSSSTGQKLDSRTMLRNAIIEEEQIELSYKDNVFSLEFAALDYRAPGKNQYKYMMEGFDTEWIDSGTRRFVNYTNLSAGDYLFKVIGSNNDGVWNQEGASLRLIIHPPWWKTSWAYSLFAVGIIAIIFMGLNFELNRRRLKDQLHLEHLEAEKLHELDHIKSRFFANISHEFRTPLTLILGPAEKLLTGDFGGNIKNQYKLIIRNAHRLLRLVNQMMDLSKLESGKLMLCARPGNLIAFLKGILNSFESLAQSRQIALRFKSNDEALMLYYDYDKMEQVFNNLLSNAFKFTTDGGSIKVVVTSGSSSSVGDDTSFDSTAIVSDFVDITVSDTGAGIPATHLPHIFDRFYQASDTNQQGSGVGLALTKELVALHQGEINVTSEMGKGAIFTIRLPQGKDHLKPEEILSDKIELSTKGGSFRLPPFSEAIINEEAQPSLENKLTSDTDPTIILVVEDNPEMRAYISDILTGSYRVLEAADGQEGFDKAADLMPDLIISDVMMPAMDGYQFCKKIKSDERTSHIPIILLTAKSSGESKVEGLQLGADDYLIKPFNSTELRVRIQNLIDQRRKLRERFSREVKLQPADIAITPADEAFLQRAMQLVERRLDDPDLSVAWLSKEIYLSRSQLHRKLHALINQSTSEFIRSLRLKRAAQLLEQQAATVSEIAYMTGFNSPAYFRKCFREQFGTTPTEYASSQS